MRLPLAPAALPGTELTFDRLAVAMNASGPAYCEGKIARRRSGERILGWLKPRPVVPGSRLLGEGATALEELTDRRYSARRSKLLRMAQ